MQLEGSSRDFLFLAGIVRTDRIVFFRHKNQL